MMLFYYIGLDIHKKMIAYCIKALDGRLIELGIIDADRKSVGEWVNNLPGPWIGANHLHRLDLRFPYPIRR